ncbi:MAG: alpha/beta fold hydrolase [Verrucomicrobiaceae bacterium]|nr:MAG: alpha/beta fold hydrolase [Verrucomicrobiaceae bacterium]
MTERTIHFETFCRIAIRALPLVAGALLLNSCATLDLLSKDVRAMDRDTKIFGSVIGTKARVEKVLVLKKSTTGDGFTVADSVKPNGMGDFAFLLPREKSYYLAAVAKGGSRKTDGKHELIGIAGNRAMKEIPWREDSAKQEIVLKLAPSLNREAPAARDVVKAVDAWKPENGTGGSVPIACGDVVSLKNPSFNAENGNKGLWAPLTAARLYGLGIYFLQPYQPARIPVIFVHGIGGTPRIWEPLIASLDKKLYQPWIFSYPSGLPIEDSAKALADLTHRLQGHHHFKKSHVVAHSMGGLVARRAVQMIRNEKRKTYITSLTTISTPWNGVTSTVLGTLGLPVPVPCWFDLKPNGKFVSKILSDPLPVPHLLISTEKSRFRFALERKNDGSVSVASQLDPRAVSQATARLMIHENHDSVLAADQTLDAVGAFLR